MRSTTISRHDVFTILPKKWFLNSPTNPPTFGLVSSFMPIATSPSNESMCEHDHSILLFLEPSSPQVLEFLGTQVLNCPELAPSPTFILPLPAFYILRQHPTTPSVLVLEQLLRAPHEASAIQYSARNYKERYIDEARSRPFQDSI